MGSKKIYCPHCRQESTVKMVKQYDGFTPVGEIRTCAFCGFEFGDEEPDLIREESPDWVKDGELKKICHRCLHYVVNPFIQKCVLRQKEVEATDTCPDFQFRPGPPPPPTEKDVEEPPPLLGPPPATPDIF